MNNVSDSVGAVRHQESQIERLTNIYMQYKETDVMEVLQSHKLVSINDSLCVYKVHPSLQDNGIMYTFSGSGH